MFSLSVSEMSCGKSYIYMNIIRAPWAWGTGRSRSQSSVEAPHELLLKPTPSKNQIHLPKQSSQLHNCRKSSVVIYNSRSRHDVKPAHAIDSRIHTTVHCDLFLFRPSHRTYYSPSRPSTTHHPQTRKASLLRQLLSH